MVSRRSSSPLLSSSSSSSPSSSSLTPVYILISILYVGLAANFVLVYQSFRSCTSFDQSYNESLLRPTFIADTLSSSPEEEANSHILLVEPEITTSGHHKRSHQHRRTRRHQDDNSSHHPHHHRRSSSSSSSSSSSDSSVPSVEFFPKPQATSDAATSGNGHVWLTSYSRIPLPALQEYCYSSKDYCPAGLPGPPGEKGEPGSSGPRGISGPRGPPGPPGGHGLQGSKGESGEPGLDGREGLPGEPGLDGVPGRDGIDGLPGMDGIPGLPGKDGSPGVNGTDGIPGTPGLRGPPGPAGSPGLPGPRGRKGLAGVAGKPGVPGINAWIVNGSEPSRLLIPPKMSEKEGIHTTLSVQEGDNIRIPCVAEGLPPPKYSWRRTDNKPIHVGHWANSVLEGPILNMTRVRRDHFGSYVCFANNGVPPPASHQVNLEVTFPPTVKVRQQMIGTSNGSSVLLECHFEAFPPALTYWMKGENKMIENNWKYKMSQEDVTNYSGVTTLNISYIEPNDYSLFKCIAKNERGRTFALLTVYEIDPNRPKATPTATSTTDDDRDFVVFGQASLPPYEPCPACPDCPVLPRCPKGYNLYDAVRAIPVVGSHQNRSSWVPFKQRQKHCILNQIGKPVFYRDSEADVGSWMQESSVNSVDPPGQINKFWMTTEDESSLLLEFSSKDSFRHKNVTRRIPLPVSFVGNGQLVYDGNFFYHQVGTNRLIKYDLTSNQSHFRSIEESSFREETGRLYETQVNYMDVMSDENGLWVIFAGNGTNNTLIVKMDPVSLGTENVWNLTLDHQMIGEMFIACGVLYGVESSTDTFTKIRFAFDLYLNSPLDVSVNFTNPFKHNNLLSYNPRLEKIFAWDSRNLIEYPLRFLTVSAATATTDDATISSGNEDEGED